MIVEIQLGLIANPEHCILERFYALICLLNNQHSSDNRTKILLSCSK